MGLEVRRQSERTSRERGRASKYCGVFGPVQSTVRRCALCAGRKWWAAVVVFVERDGKISIGGAWLGGGDGLGELQATGSHDGGGHWGHTSSAEQETRAGAKRMKVVGRVASSCSAGLFGLQFRCIAKRGHSYDQKALCYYNPPPTCRDCLLLCKHSSLPSTNNFPALLIATRGVVC